MTVDKTIRETVKEELISMVVEDPSILEDLCGLDIDVVFDRAEAKLKSNDEYQDQITKEKMGAILSFDTDLDKALEIWKGLDSSNDKDLADEHFDMCQSLEYSLTIKQMADQL